MSQDTVTQIESLLKLDARLAKLEEALVQPLESANSTRSFEDIESLSQKIVQMNSVDRSGILGRLALIESILTDVVKRQCSHLKIDASIP